MITTPIGSPSSWLASEITDGLQRLFARTGPVWPQLRNWGLSGFDHSGPLKRWMVQQAMGASTTGKTSA